MLLDIRSRLMLLGILPAEGDITTVKVIRKLREDLSFSEDEHKKYNIKVTPQDNGNATIDWDETKEEPKDIKIGMKARDVIVTSLEKLNTDKKLTEQHIDLYERFVNSDAEKE